MTLFVLFAIVLIVILIPVIFYAGLYLCMGITWVLFAIKWFFMILYGLFLEVVKFFKGLFKK